MSGLVSNVSIGGIFFAVSVLVEVGEIGTLTLGEQAAHVRVAWLKSATAYQGGTGVGITFLQRDGHEEEAAIELALAVLDSGL